MHNTQPKTAILMATYNGAPYIAAQIESILKQSQSGWKLYIRDDGSDDGTSEIAQRFADEFPDRIAVFPTNGVRLGADGNFFYLLEHVESDYFMFADQDDVWLPEKIERSLKRMLALESEYGPKTPLLVHTDLRVVDEHLQELHPSAWNYGYHNPAFSRRLNRLLVQNMVFGCTTLINAALKEAAIPIPKEAVGYDRWLAFTAVCLGHVDYLAEATILYRQHGGNTVGAAHWGPRYVIRKALRFFDREHLVKPLVETQSQAAVLLRRYEDRLSPEQQRVLSAYAALGEQGFIARRRTLVQHGLWKTGLIRNIGLFLRV